MYKVLAIVWMDQTKVGTHIWALDCNTHEAAIACQEFLKNRVSAVTIIPDDPDESEENDE